MNQSQVHKSRAAYRHQLKEKRLNPQIIATIILLIVTALVNFQAVPNINSYINSDDFTPEHINTALSSKSKSASNQLIINAKKKSSNESYQISIKSVEGVNNFANQVDIAAQKLANQLHKDKLSPKQLIISTQNDNYFDRYGYTPEQFMDLLMQHYYHQNIKISHWKFTTYLIQIVALIINISALIFLVYYFVKK